METGFRHFQGDGHEHLVIVGEDCCGSWAPVKGRELEEEEVEIPDVWGLLMGKFHWRRRN